MTNEEILDTAMRQSALDLNADPSDFAKAQNVIVRSGVGPLARKYYTEPIACNFVSYGRNVVVSVRDEFRSIAEEYVGRYAACHCFETPNMHWLEDRIRPLGQRVCFMAEYFLPDVNALTRFSSPFRLEIMTDFDGLYLPEWSNALCESRKELDVLGVGAYDGDNLIGFAACSADCDDMWQIGVDVLPEYRRQGVASAVTGALTEEILARDKVPFYCSAWSNLASVRNALRCGFRPAWTEMTVKPAEVAERLNIIQGEDSHGIT